MEEELLQLEREFERGILANDPERIARVLSPDWIIISSDGRIIERVRFLDVIRSGALVHREMRAEDIRIRMHGDTAVLTALTTTEGEYMGQAFTTLERATDVFARVNGNWQCVLTQLTSAKK